MKNNLKVALVILFLTNYLSAQAEENLRKIRFSIFAESDTSMGTSEQSEAANSVVPRIRFSYLDGNGSMDVDVPAAGFQGAFTATVVDNRLNLYAHGSLNLETVAQAQLIANLDIPPSWDDVIIYSFRSLEDSRARFVVLADRDELVRTKKSFCINLTKRPIAVNIGEDRFMLESYGRDSFEVKQAAGGGLVSIKVAGEWRETWKLALSTSRRLQSGQSYLFLFKGVPSNPRSMSLRIVDIPEPEQKDRDPMDAL
jgi:hypothetical protein